MLLRDALLPEYDQEMANTRKTLERVPEDKFGWKPHQKSGTMIWLAAHVANIPDWAAVAINHDSLDLAPGGVPMVPPPPPKSTRELVGLFEKNAAAGRAAIAGVSDEQLATMWTLLKSGQEVLKMPRYSVLRSVVMNHLIHHRAQLTVYLRLNDVAVPALYGPSADEGTF